MAAEILIVVEAAEEACFQHANLFHEHEMLYDHLVEGNLIIECNTDNCQLHELLPSMCPVKDKYLRILNFLVERNIKEK